MSVVFLMRLGRGFLVSLGCWESRCRQDGCGGIAGAGNESPSDQGRGTSEASGAWPRRRSGVVGRWRALAAQGLGDLRLPDPDKDRQLVREADGLRGLGRDGSLLKRR